MVIALTTMSTFWISSASTRSRRCQQPELHLVRIADHVPGDLTGDVDVEALQFPGHRIAETEQVGALVDADDQPAAAPDLVHGRADCGGRAQTRGGIAAPDVRARTRRHDGGAAGHRQRGQRSGHVGQRLHRRTARRQGRCEREQCGEDAHQWYSLSRGAIPAATASADSTPIAAAPAGSRFNAVYACAIPSRCRSRSRVMSSRNAVSNRVNCTVESCGSSSRAIATAPG